LNCINWHIAFKAPEEVEPIDLSPQEVVQMAIEHDVPTICFTYNDPIVLYEYMYDTFRLAKEKGLKTTFHSNGSLNLEPMKAILKYTDAVVIDLKAFTEGFYREICDGELTPVLDCLQLIKREGCGWKSFI
jgi:pyruvate formate lyase activating enzyme